MNIYEIINNRNKYKFSCIYLWKNLNNGKLYVGQAQNFYIRMKQYYRNEEKHRLIGKAICKYGFNNFDISVLEKVEIDLLDEREQYWMDYYNSYDLSVGYNISPTAGSSRGVKHTEEFKRQVSNRLIGNQFAKGKH